jgi:NADP-dependent 3-hydroxy acid dehydrogenase YdfG
MNRLSNKTALITGGTSGIGLETAREFVSEGARVAVTARNLTAFEGIRKEFGDKLLTIASDAGDVPGQKKVAETIQQEFGRLDILFLNAGIVEMAPLEAWDESTFDRSSSPSCRFSTIRLRSS